MTSSMHRAVKGVEMMQGMGMVGSSCNMSVQWVRIVMTSSMHITVQGAEMVGLVMASSTRTVKGVGMVMVSRDRAVQGVDMVMVSSNKAMQGGGDGDGQQ